MNSARNELLRAVRNGSTDEFKQRGVNKIKDMLLSNDFTPSVIERLMREINLLDQHYTVHLVTNRLLQSAMIVMIYVCRRT